MISQAVRSIGSASGCRITRIPTRQEYAIFEVRELRKLQEAQPRSGPQRATTLQNPH